MEFLTHEGFGEDGLFEPLGRSPAEVQQWLDRELASFVENRFGAVVDLDALTPELRANWTARVLAKDEGDFVSPHAPGAHRKAFWIREAGRRCGTIALDTMSVGHGLLRFSSLYLDQSSRGRGIATRVLDCVYRYARRSGLHGFVLNTEWSWQRAVGYYLRRGLWVRGWKHSLQFRRDETPPCRLSIAADSAELYVQDQGTDRLGIVAFRKGDKLEWREADWLESRTEQGLLLECVGTLALALAVRGWPLVRSEETWASRYDWSDGGYPEGLAYKIQVFEAYDRHRGYAVRTPRIPGLEYPSYEDLE